MTGTPYPLVRGRMLRVTKLDGCGNVLLGPRSRVVTEGFITIAMTANNDEGEAITQTTASGKNCILDEPIPKFQSFTNEITLCGVHPELFKLMTGQDVVMNAEGTEAIGVDVGDDVNMEASGFAIELWSGVPQDVCEDGEATFGYFLEPFLKGGTIGDLSVENAAINMVISGAKTKRGNGWGVGPYNVELDEDGIEGPLNHAILPRKHFRVIKTQVPPPDETDGAVAVGVQATGANSSTTPATLSPGNSYPPADLAAAITGPFTATPNTAWAAGKYVTLGDGSKAHWNSTAWVAGIA